MSTCQRALLALKRKYKRNITLFLITSIIFSSFLATSLISSTIGNLKNDMIKTMNNSFSLTHEKGLFSQQEADKALDLGGIKTANYEYGQPAQLSDPLKAVENPYMKNTLNPNEIGVIGVSETRRYALFEKKTLTLLKGDHITSSKGDEALVHERFAKENNLDLQKKFTITNNGKTLELTVAGIFSGDDHGKESKPNNMIENNIFTSLDSLRKLDASPDKQIGKASYYARTTKDLDAAIEEAKKIYGNDEDFRIVNRSKHNKEVVASLELMQAIVNNFLVGMMIVGVFILSFVLIFSVRSRIKEIGILLSIGVSKTKILLQFLMEFLLLGLTGWLFAFLCSLVLSKQMTHMILGIFAQLGEELNSDLFINTSLSIESLLMTTCIGFSVILLSIVIATIPIMVKRPKEILHKIS